MSDPEDTSPADALIDRDAGRKYWNNVSADVNGMLGGIPSVSKVDLQGSRNFLAKLGIGTKAGQRVVDSALEGGAGWASCSYSLEELVLTVPSTELGG